MMPLNHLEGKGANSVSPYETVFGIKMDLLPIVGHRVMLAKCKTFAQRLACVDCPCLRHVAKKDLYLEENPSAQQKIVFDKTGYWEEASTGSMNNEIEIDSKATGLYSMGSSEGEGKRPEDQTSKKTMGVIPKLLDIIKPTAKTTKGTKEKGT